MLKTSEERGDTLHVKFLVILNPGTSLLALEVHIGSRKRNLKGMQSDSLRGNRFQLGFERQWCFCGTKMRYVISKGENKLKMGLAIRWRQSLVLRKMNSRWSHESNFKEALKQKKVDLEV